MNYTTHASVAARVRRNKEIRPETYCAVRICLWNTRGGTKPCPKHHQAKPAPVVECVACWETITSSQQSFVADKYGNRCHEGRCRSEYNAMMMDEECGPHPLPEPHYEEFGASYKDWIR